MTAVENGRQALQLIQKNHFDLVILDVMMPDLNGYDVLKSIRQIRSRIELPVIMVTARNQNEDIVKSFDLGANDYLTKPVNFAETLSRGNTLVVNRQLQQDFE